MSDAKAKFPSIEGQQVPDVTFAIRQGDEWVKKTTDDYFAGKKVVVFSLPGAFTPTCSSTHLPRYNELADVFKAHGVDSILCISVNDTFVMNAWGADQEAENIELIPDGNGEFSEKMGLLDDFSALGFGKRSWRYSMLVEDKTISKMFIEPDLPGDPFEVSDADTMLLHIAPEVTLHEPVTIFTKPGCPYCARAKEMLEVNHMAFEELVMGKEASISTLKAVSGRDTVPQVFIGGQHIGGSDDLAEYFADKQA